MRKVRLRMLRHKVKRLALPVLGVAFFQGPFGVFCTIRQTLSYPRQFSHDVTKIQVGLRSTVYDQARSAELIFRGVRLSHKQKPVIGEA